MSYEDYSQLEIDNIIVEIKTIYFGKLKQEEAHFISILSSQHNISQHQRDTLIKLYDSLSDGTLEG